MEVDYVRNGQTYNTTTFDLTGTDIVSQGEFRFEYLYCNLFYTTMLETPVHSSNNITFFPGQLSTLTIEDQIALNEYKTTNSNVRVSGFVMVAGSNQNLSNYFFHAGVVIYTDGFVNFLVPYFVVSPNSLFPN